jgi:hypothetical protein
MRNVSRTEAVSPVPASATGALSVPRRLRRTRIAALLGGVLAVLAVAAGALAGLWFFPFIAGLAAALAGRRRWRRAALPSVAIAVAGWAVPLVWRAARGEPVGAVARAVAALAGLPTSAALILAATLLIAALQALTAVWLVCAVGPRPAR